jgi:IS30 family transposase
VLKRDKGTISREVARNRRRRRQRGGAVPGPYEATVAQNKACSRRNLAKHRGKKINNNRELEKYIIARLNRHWSPDEISGKMKLDKEPFYVSKTAIYEWLYSVYGQQYCHLLFNKQYRSKKRPVKKTKRTMISNRVGIEFRPEEINQRATYGHYEGDTIVSGKKTGSNEALAVNYERKARYVLIRKLDSLKPRLFVAAIVDMKKRVTIDSCTLDNGIENKDHGLFGVDVYFCDPYSSWQKGGVENVNKMIRRFIPKGCDISDYSDEYVKMVEDILNNKPRRSLGYKTPLEVMRENNLLKEDEEVALGG